MTNLNLKNIERCKNCGKFLGKKHNCINAMQGKKHSKLTKKKIGLKSKDRNWAEGERNGSWKKGFIKFTREKERK